MSDLPSDSEPQDHKSTCLSLHGGMCACRVGDGQTPKCQHGVHPDSVCDQCAAEKAASMTMEEAARLYAQRAQQFITMSGTTPTYPATIYPTPDLPRQMPDIRQSKETPSERMYRIHKELMR